MGETVKFGSGSELRVVAQEGPARRMFFTCRKCKAVEVRDFYPYWTVTPGRPSTRRTDYGRVVAGWFHFLPTNQEAIPRCPCGGRVELAELQAVHNAEVVCNARCMGAHGPSCECSCGGANHGGRHLV